MGDWLWIAGILVAFLLYRVVQDYRREGLTTTPRKPESRVQSAEKDTEWRDARDAQLRREWREELREHLGPKKAKEMEPCLRELFGGDIECLFNFRMFVARAGFGQEHDGPVAFFVPPGDHYRQRFDTLVKTGAILTGAAVSIPVRLERVAIDRVRRVAAELGLGKSRNKLELAKRIAAADAQAAEAALTAEGLGAQDCFLLDPARIRKLCG